VEGIVNGKKLHNIKNKNKKCMRSFQVFNSKFVCLSSKSLSLASPILCLGPGQKTGLFNHFDAKR